MNHTFVKGDKVQYIGSYVHSRNVNGDFRAEVLEVSVDSVYIRFNNGRKHRSLHGNVILLEANDEPTRPPPADERGGGMKFDGGKEQPRLLHEGVPLAIAEVVRTLTFGARKYAAHSWQTVPNAEERYQDASYRHDAARCAGQVLDPETGIRHRAHHIINELFLLELEMRKEKENGVRQES